MDKTLIGKNNYLFLKNDEYKELEVHCKNLNMINIHNLQKRYRFKNFYMVIYPDKSYLYKHFLPNIYDCKYRPSFDKYKQILDDKLLDSYEYLKDVEDVYYKTDTHINFKGNYIIYTEFINNINKMYNLDLIPKKINIHFFTCDLDLIGENIGDLTLEKNLGNQILNDKRDNYYYSNDILKLFCHYKISKNKKIQLLDQYTQNITEIFENKILTIDIVSNYILYQKNNGKKYKVLIFYDSFLLNILDLYLEMFNEVYMTMLPYSNELIDNILPDYVFEFRTERLLQ